MYARLPDGKENLFQWDTKQYLEVSQDVTRVDFCFRVDPDTVYGVFAKNGICYIPNLLLQKAGIVDALIMSTEIGTVRDRRLEFPVFDRPSPPGYIATKDGAIISYDDLEAILGEMNFLKTTGGTMTGDIDMNRRKITGLVDPVGDSDAVRKRYVDTNFENNKGYTDSLVDQAKKDLEDKTAEVYQVKKLVFAGKTIPVEDWKADTTYKARPFRAAVPLENVKEEDMAQVIFSDNDMEDYGFGANAITFNGGVYVFIDQAPKAVLTVPAILIWR